MDGQPSLPVRASSITNDHHGKLACQACQRKKIKCSRTYPCEQCTRAGVSCVQSTRKPRTRHVGKRAVDSELRSRIAKLESLVDSLGGEVNAGQDATTTPDPAASPEPRDPSSAVRKYMGSPFWSSLISEVQALRDALEDEESGDDADVASPPTASDPAPNPAGYDLIFCPPGSIYVMPGALNEPSQELSARLCDVFLDSVDRFLKTLHQPTIRRMINDNGYLYFGHDATHPVNKALKAAIWFSAVNSLSEEENLELFGQTRKVLLPQYRKMVDVALSQADILNTTELAGLQALLIYVAALRRSDTSRRTWTLVAVIVRIARALGLHHETVVRTPFETEVRRRLWSGVRFLDIWIGIDRATELLILPGSFDVPLPHNVDDSEFDETSTEIPNLETGLTDMSFSLLASLACNCTLRLTLPEHKPDGDTWQKRFEVAQEFAQVAQDRFVQHCDTSIPIQRILYLLAHNMANGARLRAVRPMQKHLSSVPPPCHSPFVMTIASQCLRASEVMDADPAISRFRWMPWVQWHALAVSLAGLCFQRDNDLARDAWPLVERSFVRHARDVADSRTGLLWRPIEKLYRKAVAFRDHGDIGSHPLSSPSSLPAPPSRAADLGPLILNPYVALPQPPAASTPMMAAAPPTMSQLPAPPPPPPPPPVPMAAALSTLSLNHNGLPHGAMPTGGVDAAFDFSDSALGSANPALGGDDPNWMDFERMFDDLSAPGPAFGGFEPDASWQMLQGQDWAGAL